MFIKGPAWHRFHLQATEYCVSILLMSHCSVYYNVLTIPQLECSQISHLKRVTVLHHSGWAPRWQWARDAMYFHIVSPLSTMPLHMLNMATYKYLYVMLYKREIRREILVLRITCLLTQIAAQKPTRKLLSIMSHRILCTAKDILSEKSDIYNQNLIFWEN